MSTIIEAAQRAEIQRIAGAEDTTASQVHWAALECGLPELRNALHRGQSSEVPAASGERPEVETAVP